MIVFIVSSQQQGSGYLRQHMEVCASPDYHCQTGHTGGCCRQQHMCYAASPGSLRSVMSAQYDLALIQMPKSGVPRKCQLCCMVLQAQSLLLEGIPSRCSHGICLQQFGLKHAQGWLAGGHFVGLWKRASSSSCTKEQSGPAARKDERREIVCRTSPSWKLFF